MEDKKRRDLLVSGATVTAVAAIGLGAGGLAGCSGPFSKEIDVPLPDVWRNDVMYGYFGCMGNQVVETREHINLFMETNWMGLDGCIANILTAKLPTILDVSWYVFTPTDKGDGRTVRPDAESMLTGYFASLQAAGALQYVKILYPMDEPNNVVVNEDELVKGINLIRKVAAGFKDLIGAKYAVIYATDKPYMGIGEYDYVGIDNYDERSEILKTMYPLLKNQLKPGQKTILVPGGQSPWEQDPEPFVNFAQRNLEVGILLPFLWCDLPNSKPGIRSNKTRDQYIAAGRITIGKDR